MGVGIAAVGPVTCNTLQLHAYSTNCYVITVKIMKRTNVKGAVCAFENFSCGLQMTSIKGYYSLLVKKLEDEESCAYFRYVRMSKRAFDGLRVFQSSLKISGDSRYTDDKFQQKSVYIVTLSFWATYKVATNDIFYTHT